MSGSVISWAICKSAPRSRQITTPAPHHSVFYRPDALPAAQPTASKHWRHWSAITWTNISRSVYVQDGGKKSTGIGMEQNFVTVTVCTPWGRKKSLFFFWINLLIRSVIWQNLVLLLLVNIFIDVTHLILGIYTNFCMLLCAKSVTQDITSLTMV